MEPMQLKLKLVFSGTSRRRGELRKCRSEAMLQCNTRRCCVGDEEHIQSESKLTGRLLRLCVEEGAHENVNAGVRSR